MVLHIVDERGLKKTYLSETSIGDFFYDWTGHLCVVIGRITIGPKELSTSYFDFESNKMLSVNCSEDYQINEILTSVSINILAGDEEKE
jgi:hypothetical protein